MNPLPLYVGDAAQPTRRAFEAGFGLNRARTGPGRPFIVKRAELDRGCSCCGSQINPGDLYSHKEVSSPLCLRCLEPWAGGIPQSEGAVNG